LHDEHQRGGSGLDALREECERDDERREQYEQETQTIDANEIFGADRGNPSMTLDHLEAGSAGIEVPPQR